jgi:C-terminal processing protease CtpA/Prc
MDLSVVGIGASLQSDDGYCKIREIVPGGPAARSGELKVGDRIVGVTQENGEFTDLVDMPLGQAVKMIRGQKGTTVRLTTIPATAANDTTRKTISLVRDEIRPTATALRPGEPLHQMESFGSVMDLSVVGIGASLRSDNGYCKIREIVPGGPAARSGELKVGDRIVGVTQENGEFTDLVDMPLSQAVEMIRGQNGTTVRLTTIPATAANDTTRKTISLVRDEIRTTFQRARRT